MRAKDIIDLLKTIDGQAEVTTPVDGFGFADNFSLTQDYVLLNAPGAGENSAPYQQSSQYEPGAELMYILDGTWTKIFDRIERKKLTK